MIIRTKDSLFQVVTAGNWQGLAPVEVKEMESPINRWSGPKRTLEQWQQVLAFFEWSYAETSSESMVHWFFHEETGRWNVMPLPQKVHGMTVDLLENLEDFPSVFAQLGGPGWERMGTDHHHCTSSAFQSGKDERDEKVQEGLHTTVGGISKDEYSLDCRSSFRGVIRPVSISDWYQLPATYCELPGYLADPILKHLMTRKPPEGTTFPEWWKESVIRYEPPQSKRVKGFSYMNGESWYGGESQYGGWYKDHQTGEWMQRSQGDQQKNLSHTFKETRREGIVVCSLEDDLKDFARERKMTMTSLVAWLDKLQDNEDLEELVTLLSMQYANLEDAVREARACEFTHIAP